MRLDNVPSECTQPRHYSLLAWQEDFFVVHAGEFLQAGDEAPHDDHEDDDHGDADDGEAISGEFGDAFVKGFLGACVVAEEVHGEEVVHHHAEEK